MKRLIVRSRVSITQLLPLAYERRIATVPGVGEITYAPRLAQSLRPGMVLLGDRNFAATALLEQFAASARIRF